jgi:hypothetical protein
MKDTEKSSAEIEQFLLDLSEVSYKHGLVIGDRNIVFVMDADDYSSRYFMTPESRSFFGDQLM